MSEARSPEVDRAMRLARRYNPAPPLGAERAVWARLSEPEPGRAASSFFEPWRAPAGVLAACSAIALVLILAKPEPARSPARGSLAAARPAVPRARAEIRTGHVARFGDRSAAESHSAGTVLPAEGWWVAQADTRLSIGARDIELREGTVFRVVPAQDLLEVRLYRGDAEVSGADLQAAPATQVVTPNARIHALGDQVRVRTNRERTQVEAKPDTVRIEPTPRSRVAHPSGAAPWIVQSETSLPSVDPAQARPEPRPSATPRPASSSESRPGHLRSSASEPNEPASSSDAGVLPDEIQLNEARAQLPSNARVAAQMAREILSSAPSPSVEAGALAVLADAERRDGQLRRAAESYSRVVAHPNGRPYAEEALYRRARLLAELGDASTALAELERAERDHPRGPLAPERAGLQAAILEGAGRIGEAKAALVRASREARARGDRASELRFRERLEALDRTHPETSN